MDEQTVTTVVSSGAIGAAGAYAVFKFFGDKLLSNLLSKDLEKFKADLTKDNNVKLEQVKSDLLLIAKDEERNFSREARMKLYKFPLLHAANDLQSRFFNILEQRLCEYYGQSDVVEHRNYVVNNTCFLIAQYFAWVEIIRKDIQFIELGSNDSARELSTLIDSIYSIFQSDSFDEQLFIWAGEQRGLGELLIKTQEKESYCIGYASFLDIFESTDNVLFLSLKRKVTSLIDDPEIGYQRLVSLQNSLIDLMFFLDPSYGRFPEDKRQKVKLS